MISPFSMSSPTLFDEYLRGEISLREISVWLCGVHIPFLHFSPNLCSSHTSLGDASHSSCRLEFSISVSYSSSPRFRKSSRLHPLFSELDSRRLPFIPEIGRRGERERGGCSFFLSDCIASVSLSHSSLYVPLFPLLMR